MTDVCKHRNGKERVEREKQETPRLEKCAVHPIPAVRLP